MRYRFSQLKIDPRATVGAELKELLETALRREIRRKTGMKSVELRDLEIIRESIDARKKPDVKLVYTVDFDCDEKLPFATARREEYRIPLLSEKWRSESAGRPVVVGFGPCGMFAALVLAEAGLRPIVIERGKCVEERAADVKQFWIAAETQADAAPDPESNVQFGEGGAGTFSDGKLTTGIKDIRIRKVLEEFVEAGADPDILYKHRPHIGTDRLQQIVPEIRKKIEEQGGEVRFSTRLEDFALENGTLKGIYITGREYVETDHVILAIGHSARDTFAMLRDRGFRMEQKPFSIGVRIEHPQRMIDESQYGDLELAEILGPADYKLSYRCMEKGTDCRERGVYTFCMCPGGQVINASTEAGTSVTNGMSGSSRSGEYANSGLLVDVRTEDFEGDDPLAGVEFQKKYERLAWEHRTAGGMAQSTYGHFRMNAETDADSDPVRCSIPAFASASILEAMPVFGRRIKGFDRDDVRLTAVESRSSSPVRVLRDENLEAIGYQGVIPAGEGPGYAGGIMSAAVDGIRAAEMVIAAT